MRRIPLLLLALVTGACGTKNIPNTRVPDTHDNREVLDFVEKYRKAVEDRDIGTLLQLTSRDYFDDNGTPQGDDDIDYDALQAGLQRLRQEVLGARYQISYRAVTFTENSKVLVDLLYTRPTRPSSSMLRDCSARLRSPCSPVPTHPPRLLR